MKVAIVCDWLVGTGGAERVVLELHRLFPDAPIYTSQYDSNPRIWFGDKWFSDADIRTGWLQRLPTALKKFLPLLRIVYFSRLDLSKYDLIISSSGAEAKGINVKAGAVHLNYCHSPTHYYWMRYEDYLANPGFGKLNFLARFGLKILVGPLRKWDYKAAQKPDYMVANSNHTKTMIKKYYMRDSEVIHPPVDIDRFKINLKEPRKGYITAGRQTPYKRIDLAVEACTKLNLPLLVIGRGPEHKRLKHIAGPSITFLRNVNDEQMSHYLNSSIAFIFPGIDDFGIVAVEALAAGTPVIAYEEGGALDYVKPGLNGVRFTPQTTEALEKALQTFQTKKFNHESIAKTSEEYSINKFHDAMSRFIEKHTKTNPSDTNRSE